MQLQEEKRDTKTSLVGSTHFFKIKNSAKMIHILSSGLYTDKITAIMRELSCNAQDSHIAAGKEDIPFEVTLPNYLNSELVIRDFGIGLSDEDVLELYTTYGESTKDTSNLYTGALGLGSKSPFSYTDIFTIESIFNGIERLYTCFISDTGIPEISKLSERDTEENNGLCIKMPVKMEDFSSFEQRAKDLYKFFTPTPIVNGVANFKVSSYTKIYESKEGRFFITDEDRGWRRESNAYAIMGPVKYPLKIPEGQSNHKNKEKHKEILSLPIYLEFNMGEVDIVASREALSYTKETIKNIEERLEEVYLCLEEEGAKKLKYCKSYYEACLLYMKDRSVFGNHLSRFMNYKGKKLKDIIVFGIKDRKTFDIGYFESYYGGVNSSRRPIKWWSSSYGQKHFSVVKEPIFIYVDDSYLIRKKIFHNFQDRLGECPTHPDAQRGIFLVKGNFKNFIRQLGGRKSIFKVYKASELEAPVIKRTSKLSGLTVLGNNPYTIFNDITGTVSRGNYLKLNRKDLYFEIEGKQIVLDRSSTLRVLKTLQKIIDKKELSPLLQREAIYLLNKTQVKGIDTEEWKDISDKVLVNLSEYCSSQSETEDQIASIRIKSELSKISSYLNRNLSNNSLKNRETSFLFEIQELLDLAIKTLSGSSSYVATTQQSNLTFLKSILKELKIEIVKTKIRKEFENIEETLDRLKKKWYKEFPYTAFISQYEITEELIKVMKKEKNYLS